MASYVVPASYDAPGMMATTCVFLALTWMTVLLRVYVRGYMIRSFGWDDWLMLVTLAAFTCDSIWLLKISWIELHKDLAIVEVLDKTLLYITLESVFYLLTSMFLKLSLAVFFLRVVVEKRQRRTIWATGIIFTVYCCIFILIAVFRCGNPIHYLKNRLDGKCIPWTVLGPLNYIHGILNTISDWVFAILPIFILRKANMRKSVKVSAMFVLALGTFGSIASVIRLPFINDLHKGTENQQSIASFFRHAPRIATLSIIEPGLGIMAASMATLRPLFARIMEGGRSYGSTRPKTSPDHEHGQVTELCTMPEPERSEFARYGYAEEHEDERHSKDNSIDKTPLVAVDLTDMSELTDVPYRGAALKSHPPSPRSSGSQK